MYSLRSGASEYGQEKKKLHTEEARSRRAGDTQRFYSSIDFFLHTNCKKKKKKKKGGLLTRDSENVLINSSGSEAER